MQPVDGQGPPSQKRKKQCIGENNASKVARRTEDESSSDSDSELDQAEENISKITFTIHGTIERLFRLSNALRRSAKANRAHKIEWMHEPGFRRSSSALDFRRDRIHDRLSHLDIQRWGNLERRYYNGTYSLLRIFVSSHSSYHDRFTTIPYPVYDNM